IDELARVAGTTTRNIRAYQTRGLLPPPTLVGRVGHYDGGHLARLRLIARLQDQGFSLAAIVRLLSAWNTRQSLSELLGFEEALKAQAGAIAERFVELFERFVWEPFVAAGMPAERLPEVTDTLRRLRPLAARGVAATLGMAMQEAVASATASHLSPLVERAPAAS